VAAVRAAVAAPPSAGADMSAMAGRGELLLAALWAAMAVQSLPPSDELSFSFCVSSPVLSSCCLWHPVWCISYFSLHFFLFSCLVHGRASPTLSALTHRQQFLPYLATAWPNYGTQTTW